MREVEITLANGEKKVVKIRRITYGEYNEIMKKSVKIEYLGGTPKTSVDMVEFKKLLVNAALVDKINIDELPLDSGLAIEKAALDENGMGENGFL